MFTALGQDDTGGILWGPQTLEAARAQGVHLTEDYQIIDEQSGQTWDPATMKRLQPMTPQEIERLQHWTPAQMTRRVVRYADLDWQSESLLDAALPGCGAQMAPVIGLGMSECRLHSAPISNSHGFSIEWMRIPAGGSVSAHRLTEKQVLSVHRGSVAMVVANEAPAHAERATSAPICISNGGAGGWDSYAMPAQVWRSYRNVGNTEAVMLVMTPGDGSKQIAWAPDVMAAAAVAGYAIDANGYVALKRFTDRSQR